MSRSGYSDDCDGWALVCWRGAVTSATRGARGQAFLKELLKALDAMEDRQLITDELEAHGQFCTLGVLGNARGMKMEKIDPHCPEQVSQEFDIACALAQEVVYMNDEYGQWKDENPAQRWTRMRTWVESQITQ